MSKDITMDEVCELYGNNEERLVAVARALGVLADGWYMGRGRDSREVRRGRERGLSAEPGRGVAAPSDE